MLARFLTYNKYYLFVKNKPYPKTEHICECESKFSIQEPNYIFVLFFPVSCTSRHCSISFQGHLLMTIIMVMVIRSHALAKEREMQKDLIWGQSNNTRNFFPAFFLSHPFMWHLFQNQLFVWLWSVKWIIE